MLALNIEKLRFDSVRFHAMQEDGDFGFMHSLLIVVSLGGAFQRRYKALDVIVEAMAAAVSAATSVPGKDEY